MCERFVVHELGKVLVIAGLIIAAIGAMFWWGLMPRWLGRLPGDIRIGQGNTVFYFPVVTCILISLVLTLIMALFRR